LALDGAADLLARAQRPILIAGGQCRTLEVATWLRALAEALPAPVVVTAHGKGALPDPHPFEPQVDQGRDRFRWTSAGRISPWPSV
jgi:thiamine pyrophosphate-dependent acetolactate synthase large subunit-like protein